VITSQQTDLVVTPTGLVFARFLARDGNEVIAAVRYLFVQDRCGREMYTDLVDEWPVSTYL
jgi:hypothetical protein